jgi:hypothetical protein
MAYRQGVTATVEDMARAPNKRSGVSFVRMTDALTKLLIKKGVITDAEFTKKRLEERAVYQPHLNSTAQ